MRKSQTIPDSGRECHLGSVPLTTTTTERRAEPLLTPEEAADYLKVSAEQVRSLIRRGLLSATNVGTGTKRPLYRINREALDDFLADRTKDSGSSAVRRFKPRPPVPDFFPQLR